MPPTKVSYVAFAGGGPATAALLGNQVAAGISGYGEFAEQIKAGKLRLIAISSDQRQPGIEAPTLKEQGIDVELFNWRGVFAPPGVNDAATPGDDLADREDGGIARNGRKPARPGNGPRSRCSATPTRRSSTPRRRASKGSSKSSGWRDMATGETRAGGGTQAAPGDRRNHHRCRRARARRRRLLADDRASRFRRSTPRSGRPSFRPSRRSAWRLLGALLLFSALTGGWQPAEEEASAVRSSRPAVDRRRARSQCPAHRHCRLHHRLHRSVRLRRARLRLAGDPARCRDRRRFALVAYFGFAQTLGINIGAGIVETAIEGTLGLGQGA